MCVRVYACMYICVYVCVCVWGLQLQPLLQNKNPPLAWKDAERTFTFLHFVFCPPSIIPYKYLDNNNNNHSNNQGAQQAVWPFLVRDVLMQENAALRYIGGLPDDQQVSEGKSAGSSFALRAGTGLCMRFLDRMIQVIRLPSDWDKLPDDLQDEHKQYRRRCGDVLTKMSEIVGAKFILQYAGQRLERYLPLYFAALKEHPALRKLCIGEGGGCAGRDVGLSSGMQFVTDKTGLPDGLVNEFVSVWRGLEAILYFLRAAGRVVIRKGNAGLINGILSQLISSLKCTPAPVRYTLTLVIGRYADFCASHYKDNPELLHLAMDYIVTGMKEPSLYSASCYTFDNLCDACSHIISRNNSYYNSVINIYGDALGYMPIKSLSYIVCGVVRVVCAGDAVNDRVTQIFKPAVKLIHDALESRASAQSESKTGTQRGFHQAGSNGDEQEGGGGMVAVNVAYSRPLSVLADLFHFGAESVSKITHSKPRHACCSAFAQVFGMLWGYLNRCLQLAQASQPMMELSCRIIKHALVVSQQAFVPHANRVLEALCTLVRRSPKCAVVYAIAKTVDTLGHVKQMGQACLSAYACVATAVSKVLVDKNGIVNNPGLADDYFNLCARYINRLPHVVFAHSSLQFLLESALCALGTQHGAVIHSACRFWYFLVDTHSALETQFSKTSEQDVPPYVRTISQVVEQTWPGVLRAVILGVAEHWPLQYVVYGADVLSALWASSRPMRALHGVVRESLQAVAANPAKPSKTEFEDSLLTVRDMEQLVKDFAAACRHKRVVGSKSSRSGQ